MMLLNEPLYTFEQTIDECILGVTGNDSLREKLIASKGDFSNAGMQYRYAASTAELYALQPVSVGGDPEVINALKKSELVKLYEQYFRASEKPARKVYDAILNSAQDKCPFCGGIGTPRNLDHFLPKSHYPQFSVLPSNLVPSCRDCNMDGKGENFAISAEKQIIQPYLDKQRFFIDQWIFAFYVSVDDGEPGVFQYYVSPPESWPEVDKHRARRHFEVFDLAKRFATKAAEQLGIVLGQIRSMEQAGLDISVIKSVLLQPAIETAQFSNHWQKVMYQALCNHYTEKKYRLKKCPVCEGECSFFNYFCPLCRGDGVVEAQLEIDISDYEYLKCPECDGWERCRLCSGNGRISRDKALEMTRNRP
ncbi:hypothetical protein [Rheinheimera metallidurans]|uniref:hypothetical protein n=1 Tax=Rheinheimera metallidurans TaxID=2925781 RepID=UPI0030017B0C